MLQQYSLREFIRLFMDFMVEFTYIFDKIFRYFSNFTNFEKNNHKNQFPAIEL